MIEFTVRPGAHGGGHPGLLYDEEAMAFWSPLPMRDEFESVLVNDLELHVDAEGRVLSIDGYAPRKAWIPTRVEPPTGEEGLVVVTTPTGPRGASVRLTSGHPWPNHFNQDKGWLCVGDPSRDPGSRAVQVAPDSLLVLRGSELVAIWLRVRSLAGTRTQGGGLQ